MAEQPDSAPGAAPAPAPAWPASGVHQGRGACSTLLRDALLALAPSAAPAAWSAARQVWLLDPDFADWPLDEPAVLDALAAWLRRGGRQLHLVGQHFDTTARCHPRLARWRRDWSHALAVHAPSEGGLPPALRGLLAPPLWLQWLDAPDWRIRVVTESVHVRAADARIADFLQRCEPAWPATTVGL